MTVSPGATPVTLPDELTVATAVLLDVHVTELVPVIVLSTVAVSVWVLDGKGNVSTPYLKTSRGNIGCEIFDYEAEIIPDERLVDCISDILK